VKSSWSCDLPPGEPLTWGVPIEARECADWFNAKSIVMGGANVVQTRIPDAPFAFEARSNGAKLCVVSPDFNSSAVHADPFLQIQPGTDALQALGVAKLLIDNDGINRPSVIEQTAMPLLVRRDTGKFLREADLKPGGDAAIFSLGDRKSNAPVPAPGCEGLRKQAGDRPTSLKRDGLDVALEGSFKVKLHDGKEVEVGTVFARLREELKKYPLEKVAAETGLPAAEIAAMARDLGTRFPAMIIHGAGTNPWFPNDAINRALIVWRANSLNQAKGNELIFDSLWKQLDLIVDVNFRMDTTALSSDVVLPAASYY
jgi:nitrate reductase alpha subunit